MFLAQRFKRNKITFWVCISSEITWANCTENTCSVNLQGTFPQQLFIGEFSRSSMNTLLTKLGQEFFFSWNVFFAFYGPLEVYKF